MELNLSFLNYNSLTIQWGHQKTRPIEFASPLTPSDLDEIRWYLEVYGALYITEIDDARAERIATQLPEWGAALFEAVFKTDDGWNLFEQFCQDRSSFVVTIRASDAQVLALPWELLRVPDGSFSIDRPLNLSIRRCFESSLMPTTSERSPKERLRLLFVVSRPVGAGFLDPRADAMAVMDALDELKTDCIEIEFLRPATIPQLNQRLTDTNLPPIDILHFDGHGEFDLRKNTGYLLFARQDGNKLNPNKVKAQWLGKKLAQAKIPLVVLSACKSARVGQDEALGSVAIELLQAGVSSVLAMTHSVLAETTRRLFGEFYGNLAKGVDIATALDRSRFALKAHSLRGMRQRGSEELPLHLQDWFLPVLYQSGTDLPLVVPGVAKSKSQLIDSFATLPSPPKLGFWGRSWELWQIEEAFVLGSRRVTISGFGGQGKTVLVQEIGRWLVRVGLFRRACFVSYDGFQGIDAVEYAIAIAFGLPNETAVKASLESVSTLLILDNLETLQGETLEQLLSAAARWSRLGDSRVLLTTRSGSLGHPEFQSETSGEYLAISLSGLKQQDALKFFEQLMKASPPMYGLPEPEQVLEFFELVDFHPLSIQLLTRQLSDRPMGDVREELQQLLTENSDTATNKGLLPSLNLSLNQLGEELRQLAKFLGVFEVGTFEGRLLEITEIEETVWQELRATLESTGLLVVENLPELPLPFLKFHPVLTLALRAELTDGENDGLTTRYIQSYCVLMEYLYFDDTRNPSKARTITRRELPNLLAAVRVAFETENSDAVKFATKVSYFLGFFGMNRDRSQLAKMTENMTKERGSDAWFLARSSFGEQMLQSRQFAEAKAVFSDILTALPPEPSYQRCITVGRLGRCERAMGRAKTAVECYQEAIAIAEALENLNSVRRQLGILYSDLGYVLTEIGKFDEARAVYEKALEISKQFGDRRGEAVVLEKLGVLEWHQKNLQAAVDCYEEALVLFRDDKNIHEPASAAVILKQLATAYQTMQQWEEAEKACRDSAEIFVSLGNFVEAARNWAMLGLVNQLSGKPKTSEEWYRKAIKTFEQEGDLFGLSRNLSNFAALLQFQPSRLAEARQLAEKSLELKKKLDPNATQIAITYKLLAGIAKRQNDFDIAREYHRAALDAAINNPGTQHELRRHAAIIVNTVFAILDPSKLPELETVLEKYGESWSDLIAVVRQILEGKRDENELIEPLNFEKATIILTILRGIENQENLRPFLQKITDRKQQNS